MILSWCCWRSRTSNRGPAIVQMRMQLSLPTEFSTQSNILTRRGTQDHERWPMEKNTQEELKAHLMATNEEFRSMASRHSELHQQLEAIEAKEHLSLEDEALEQSLKKQKLWLKDQMNEVMSRYKAQQVA
jgi:uncharacterized protein YdcH (DUF465 family)